MSSSKNKEFIIIIKPWSIFNHNDSFRGEDYHAKQTAIYLFSIESVII